MGKLVDICQSAYPHKEMLHFSDKHFYSKYGTDQIICEECMSAWILESAMILAKAAYPKIKNSLYTSTNMMQSNFLVILPEYMNHLTCNTVYAQTTMRRQVTLTIISESDNSTDEEDPDETVNSPETSEDNVDSAESIEIQDKSEDELTDNEEDPDQVIGVITMAFYLSDDPSTFNPARTIVGFGNDCGCGFHDIPSVGIKHHSRAMPIPQVLYSHSIEIQLTTGNTESEDTLMMIIKDYLTALINTCYEQLNDDVVQVLMDEAGTKTYHSDVDDCPEKQCVNCGASLKDGYYLYNHHKYCINCMYNIVKVLAIDAKLAAEVGIALDSDYLGPKNLIADSIVWKRLVIDRYINAMKKAGACPGICYVP